jgi:hypothetical protein
LEGLAYGDITSGQYGDVYLYSQGNKALMFYNTITDGYRLSPVGSYKLFIGETGKTINTSGTWNCSGATFIYLSDGSSYYATQSFVTSQGYLTGTGISGTFTSQDGKTITVANGLITSIT